MAVVEPKASPLTPTPERNAEPDTGSVLRSQDGGVSHAPAFLQAAAPVATSDEAPPNAPAAARRRPLQRAKTLSSQLVRKVRDGYANNFSAVANLSIPRSSVSSFLAKQRRTMRITGFSS